MLLMFMLGVVFGAFVGAGFALRHMHSLRRDLAGEMRHELVDEFSQRFRHIENQLDYLESAIKLQLLNQYDVALPASRLSDGR